jgi:hypothetical protein
LATIGCYYIWQHNEWVDKSCTFYWTVLKFVLGFVGTQSVSYYGK